MKKPRARMKSSVTTILPHVTVDSKGDNGADFEDPDCPG